jgi:hypothetical protein
MKPYAIGRIITVLILGLLMGLSFYHRQTQYQAMGRDEYLKKQGVRFDRVYADPPPIAVAVVTCVVMTGCFIGVYELVAFGFSKLFKKNERSGEKQ